jgi:SAM-dependent methyltransferase
VDAQSLPFADRSLDVVLLFEALYYLPSPDRFMGECRRVLRPGGHVLIVTANKDLFDFNPSPYSQAYLGVVELGLLARQHGFSCDFYGVTPVDTVSLRQRALRPIKVAAVKLDLMPRTMAGKKWLKRVVFGRLSPMPAEVDPVSMQYTGPAPLAPGRPDRRYKVIYAAATLRG